MIVVTGYLNIDPAKRAEVEDAIAVLVAATQAEDGNVEYRYSADLGEPERINVVERWESEDAMNTHMATPHLAEFMSAVATVVTGVEIIRHDVSATSKIF